MDDELLSRVVAESAWETSVTTATLFTALFNTLKCQTSIHPDIFTQILVAELERFQNSSPSALCTQTLQLVKDIVSDSPEISDSGVEDAQREEIANAIGIMAACVVNAVNAQPNIDNLKFTRDLLAHLDVSSNLPSLAGTATGNLRFILQSTLDTAMHKAGMAPSTGA